jgi:hypothetical protein
MGFLMVRDLLMVEVVFLYVSAALIFDVAFMCYGLTVSWLFSLYYSLN